MCSTLHRRPRSDPEDKCKSARTERYSVINRMQNRRAGMAEQSRTRGFAVIWLYWFHHTNRSMAGLPPVAATPAFISRTRYRFRTSRDSSYSASPPLSMGVSTGSPLRPCWRFPLLVTLPLDPSLEKAREDRSCCQDEAQNPLPMETRWLPVSLGGKRFSSVSNLRLMYE